MTIQFEVRPEGDTVWARAYRIAELLKRMAKVIEQNEDVPHGFKHDAPGLGSIEVIKVIKESTTMNDLREFPYILEFAMRTPGAKVYQQQLRTTQEVVDGVNRYLNSGWDVWVHKIQQVTVESFMKDAKQKNWCHRCQEFLTHSDQAKRCEDLDHNITWKDPRDGASSAV